MRDFREMKSEVQGKPVMIMGAGGGLKKYREQILSFIKDNKVIVIGINNVTNQYVPHYHFWANIPRFKKFGKFVDPKSKLIFGNPLCTRRALIKKYCKKSWYKVKIRKVIDKHYYKDGVFYGFYHCVGNIAIHLAHVVGASDIYAVGMDGYTLHSKETLLSEDENHHCWGKGYSDQKDWEHCIVKDRVSYEILRKWDKVGVDFKILTPTVYKDFYDPTILGIE